MKRKDCSKIQTQNRFDEQTENNRRSDRHGPAVWERLLALLIHCDTLFMYMVPDVIFLNCITDREGGRRKDRQRDTGP